MIFKLK
jgi:hypothetical protein